MVGDFQVAGCHSDHAGKAHLKIKHSNGTEIVVRLVPFETYPDEDLEKMQQRILIEAAQIA